MFWISSSTGVYWDRFVNYTDADVLSAIDTLYNISLAECETRCLLHPTQCTMITWYEYMKPTIHDVPRCYLFDKSNNLVLESERPVITSFWFYNTSNFMNCINYPSNWKDIYLDDCGIYSFYNWCNDAYNLSQTAILPFQDPIYGLHAVDVCCDCNGGVFNYNDSYLVEPVWKPSSKLEIHPATDFICQSIDFSSTIINEININPNERFDFIQFAAICNHLHSTIYFQYKLLLSINAQNNPLNDINDIHSDFLTLKEFSCSKNLFLHTVTICNDTDYNNLYPFIIDLDNKNVYINSHYINLNSFLYRLPSAKVFVESYCSFSKLLNTTNSPLNHKTNIMAVTLCDIGYTINTTQHSSISTEGTEPTAVSGGNKGSQEQTMVFNVVMGLSGSLLCIIISIIIWCMYMFKKRSNEQRNTDNRFPCCIKIHRYSSIPKEHGDTQIEPKNETIEETKNEESNPTNDIQSEHDMKQTDLKPSGVEQVMNSNVIKDWSNNDIVKYWVNNLKLSEKWKQITSDAITKSGITGKDLETIKSKNDVKQLFNINNPMLNSRLWIELKKLKSESVPKIEETNVPKWKCKRMIKWSTGELLEWIKHMNLENEWNDKILNVIELHRCVGEDIVELQSIDEVCEAFELDGTNNSELGKKIYNEIKNFKPIF